MKNLKVHGLLGILASCAILASGCFAPFNPRKPSDGGEGTIVGKTILKLSVGQNAQSRTILPATPSVASYTLSSSTGSGFQKVADFTAMPATASIEPGTYAFLLEAKDSGGSVVLAQTLDNVLIGATAANLDFALTPLAAGSGRVSVTVSWPSGITVSSAQTKFGLMGEAPTTAAATISGLSTSFADDSVDYGSYLLCFRLLDANGKLLASVTEVVRVSPNLASSKTIELDFGDFNSVPTAPTGLMAVYGSAQVGLTWIDASNNETGFEVERSSDVGSSWELLTTSPLAAGSTGYTDATIVDVTGYLYRVRAVNDFGDSVDASSGLVAAMAPKTSPSIGNLIGVYGGIFNNGASDVTVSSFYMSLCEITQDQYLTVTGANPSLFPGDPNRPVERVTWYDAVEFCNKLSIADGLQPVYVISGRIPASGYPITNATVTPDWTKNGYRLPTEAEWEFAARGGTLTHGYTYAGSNIIGDVAWYSVNSGSATHAVATLAANELGFHDMSGNVWEWCWDWWNESYPSGAQINPTGPGTGTLRILRGGSWQTESLAEFSVSWRMCYFPWNFSMNVPGIRVLRSATASVDGSAPATPTGLTATAGDGQVTLAWTNPADVDFASVEISWTPPGGLPGQPLTVAIPATSQVITGLTNGTTYTFMVMSVDSAGNVSGGVTVTDTPLAPISSATIGILNPVYAGTFNNGASDVTLSPFYMSVYEITQAQYLAVSTINPSYFTGDLGRPVEMVTWYDAVEFCNKLSLADGLQSVYVISGRTPASGYPITSATVTPDWSKNGYRLPTEAEWMWAAMGATSDVRTGDLVGGVNTGGYTKGYAGSIETGGAQVNIGTYTWYYSNSDSTTHPVGTAGTGGHPNELGLYDMSGNVWEWCWDWWYENYPNGAQVNPTGAASGTNRTIRGGGWFSSLFACGVSTRNSDNPGSRNHTCGIRVVRSATATVDGTAPANPTGLTATGGDGQVTLGWTNPADADFAAVEISWTPTGGLPVQPLTVAIPGASQVITGLADLTDYAFTLKSVDSAGNKSAGAVVVKKVLATKTSPTIGTLRPVYGGTFNNGVSDVTLSPFHMSAWEITQAQYFAVTGLYPSAFTGDLSRPVEQVTWYDAIEFCNELSVLDGLTPVYAISGRIPESIHPITGGTVTATWANNGYRLPTEAQWEWAARGGTLTHGYSYAGSNTIINVAWYFFNSGSATHAVGTKAANELWLYDMSGNVWEWCWDWYGDYPSWAQTDPTGAASGPYRVLRGGGWLNDVDHLAVSSRYDYAPDIWLEYLGFRVVRP